MLSFSFKGIKNIEELIKLSFYKNSIDTEFDKTGYKVKGIYGENGVGKSAIITAVKIYRNIMLKRRFLSSAVNNKNLSYLINKNIQKAYFESEFLMKEEGKINLYRFVLEIGKNEKNGFYEIINESCMVKKAENRYRSLYEVKDGDLKLNINSKFDHYAKDISRNLLKENSFLSVITDNREDNIFKNEIKKFYEPLLCHLKTYVYMDDKDIHEDYIQYEMYKESETNAQSINSVGFIGTIDYLTCNRPVQVKKEFFNEFQKQIDGLTSFIQKFKPSLSEIEIEKKEDKDSFVCELIFDYGNYKVNGEFESTGIKKLVELYRVFKRADEGQIVFIDELDANIHDFYLCKLLEYTAEYAKGQLCFTTHNLGPMRVLKKYKKSIDFLSRDGELVPWIKNGNYQVDSLYSKGLIRKSPFNMEAFEFLEVFGDR